MPIYIWYPIVVGLALGWIFMNIPPAGDQFMALFGVGYGGLAFFLSGMLWSHSFAQIPAGMIVDRFGAFRVLVIAALVATLVNLLPFLAPDNLAFATSLRFILGLCSGLLFLSVIKIIGCLAPPSGMVRAQGAYGGAFGFGTMFPYAVIPLFGGHAWIFAYLIGGALFLVVLVCAFLIPRAQLPQAGIRSPDQPPLLRSLGVVLKSKPIWALGIIHGFSYGTMNNVGQWLPSILADLSESEIGKWTLAATGVLFLGSLARSLSGGITRFMTKAQVAARSVFLVAVLFLCLGLSQWTMIALVIGLALGFVSGINYGSVFTLGSRAMAPLYMATAVGLLNMLANVVNVLLTLLLGNVREFTGSFGYGLIAAGAAAGAVWLVARGIVEKLDKSLDK